MLSTKPLALQPRRVTVLQALSSTHLGEGHRPLLHCALGINFLVHTDTTLWSRALHRTLRHLPLFVTSGLRRHPYFAGCQLRWLCSTSSHVTIVPFIRSKVRPPSFDLQECSSFYWWPMSFSGCDL
jgi:hypothetical protein|uniref:Uncharacterized protein n=1 Tax=Zea mays TaxID=4577 RepID=A0A804P0E4_MAIZE